MYAYICQGCGVEENYREFKRIGQARDGCCPLCGGRQLRAVSSPNITRPFTEHYNPSLGAPVSSHREFADGLKRASEEQSEITGTEHRYVPVDMRDTKALGVTDEGLDSTARMRRKQGLDAPTKKIIV